MPKRRQKSSYKTANPAGLAADATSAESRRLLDKAGYDTVAKVEKSVGRQLTNAERSCAYIGGTKSVWKDIAERNGYNYITTKEARW